MRFADRTDAGRRLARELLPLASEDVVVLGLPRGGVVVAAEVARALGAPLDVVVVRKLGLPGRPELALGALGEGGARTVDEELVRLGHVTPQEVADVEQREARELERRVLRLRGEREPVPLDGRTAVVVDDGIATGSTARVACRVARARGAASVVLAAPVGPEGVERRMRADADRVVCLDTPSVFLAVGQAYVDFSQTTDEEVVDLLRRAAPQPPALQPPDVQPSDVERTDVERTDVQPPDVERTDVEHRAAVPPAPWAASRARDEEVTLRTDRVQLSGHLTVPAGAPGVVVFAHGSGSSRHSPRNRAVAATLNEAGLGTLLFDLLALHEERDRGNVFDVDLLARRLRGVTAWLHSRDDLRTRRVGLFGASTGAAAALWAAAEPDADVAAVVSRGGRPDLALPRLGLVRAPTLLVVGGEDDAVLRLNSLALARLRCERRLEVVPGASHLFEEPGALEQVARLAADWFVRHLTPAPPADA